MPRRTDLKPTPHPGIQATEGGFVIRVRVQDPRTGRPVDRTKTIKGDIRKALREQARLAEQVLERGTSRRMRLSEYASPWLERKAATMTPHTAGRYGVALTHHILPQLGNFYLDALSPALILEWRDERANACWTDRKGQEHPYGPRTVNGWLRVLRTLLADAYAELRLGVSPASRVQQLPEPPAYTDDDPNVLSAEELAALLVALAERPTWHALFLTQAMLGLRTCEVTALKWTDLRGEMLLVQRSAVRGHVRETTKTGKTRLLPLPPAVLKALCDQRALLVEEAAETSRRRGEIVEVSPWCFPSRTGAPRHGTTLAKPLKAASRAAGITKRFTPHGLRRTLNDVLRLVASADVQKAITGHSSEQMRAHYAWVTPTERAAAIGRVAEVLKLEGRR